MNKSLFVWVGKQQAKLNDLSVAMPAFGTQVTYTVKRLGQELEAAVLNDYYENYKSSPAATAVMGLDVSEASRNLARRLGKSARTFSRVCIDFMLIDSCSRQIWTTVFRIARFG